MNTYEVKVTLIGDVSFRVETVAESEEALLHNLLKGDINRYSDNPRKYFMRDKVLTIEVQKV